MTQMPPPLLASPPDGFEGAVLAGRAKANMPAEKVFFSGCLAGSFIGYGAYLACTVGGCGWGGDRGGGGVGQQTINNIQQPSAARDSW